MKSERGSRRSAHVQLRQKLYHSNLYRQFHLIKHMNRELEVRLDHFMAWPELPPALTLEQLEPTFKQVGFLRLVRKRTWRGEHDYVRLDYDNASKIVLVTGWHRQALLQIVNDFNQGNRRDYHYPSLARSLPSAKVTSHNGFWTTMETNSEATAALLKKYLRSKKRNLDEAHTKHYKIEKRRIRIVVLKEDLFTLLVDAMTEIKSELFMASMQLGNQRRSRPLENLTFVQELKAKGLSYRPSLLNYYQQQGVRSEYKEEQLSDGLKSESNSLNSDILESNRLKDCIQTTEQGTQAAQTQAQEQVPTCLSHTQSSPSPQQSPQHAQQVSEGVASHKTSQTLEAQQKLEAVEEFIVRQQKQKVEAQSQLQQIEPQGGQQQIGPKIATSNVENKGQVIGKQSPSSANTAVQTREGLYTQLTFAAMRRHLREFKQIGSRQLVELPEWVRNESEEERRRHRFFDSQCRPSILERSRPFP